ncbi:MAG: hypothetical protein LBH12_01585 [Dysgonamonadaceae bacterium]|jgi:cell division protein FtsQ|nr:hypothetical protein [Dysgonamonadaceae bacterium]
MIKKILFIFVALLLISYIVFAIVYMNPKVGIDKECKDIQVEISGESVISYLTEQQVLSYLNTNKMNPVGKKLSDIKFDSIEKVLTNNKLIKSARVYKTINGSVKIEVFQRTPILRVISEKGNYYVDNESKIMPVPANFAAYVPVATGNISEEYAKNQLFEFALFLHKNKFWNSQIEQINVQPNLDVELIPRVGNHVIILGKIESYKENLDKLKLFYDKGLNKIGWNRYSVVNLKFENQVVCTKR